MVIATAGFTAALGAMTLPRRGVKQGDGELLVTDAAGDFGPIAVALLGGMCDHVVGSTSRSHQAAYLKALATASIADRNQFRLPGKPLHSERWAGVVDTGGSHTLVNASAQTRFNGAMVACGLAGGSDFHGTMGPFILRGVTLYGISEILNPDSQRRKAWTLLAQHTDSAKLESMTHEIRLTQVVDRAPDTAADNVRGRLMVDVNR